ncbi:hypothetical protein [Vreelandella profundi]|uniref:hypothetical protein n=1 Tax=Vreelandella profundi TaxID=2852117 RepID=UPI001F25C6CD|nr:hypothetical protein [Halomonas profundi]
MRITTYRSNCWAYVSLTKRLFTTALLAGSVLLTTAAISRADTVAPAAPTLADAWLETLPQLTEPVSWSHAYALLAAHQERFQQERRYLVEELNTLIISAQAAGNTLYRQTIAAWRDTLRSLEGQPLRSPERLDLLKLGTNLREAPLLDRVIHWGACEIPTWVEVWGLQGVTRTAWQPGMTLDTLAHGLNARAFTSIDYVHLVTPQAEVIRRGIAAWNHEDTPLAPGSRIAIELPTRQGLMGALPFPGTTHELDIINQRLPGVLAAQLPGDQCTQWQAQ